MDTDDLISKVHISEGAIKYDSRKKFDDIIISSV